MAEESGFGSGRNDHQPTVSASLSVVNRKGEEGSDDTVPYYKLFSFADSTDARLMILGTIEAVANGVSMPILTLLLGDLVNAFGQNINNKNTLREVSRVHFHHTI
ncbi:ABC-type xenobiotic transporter [Ranunculus cassubicifolius]